MLRFAYLDIPNGAHVLLWGDSNDLRNLADLLRTVPSLPSETALVEHGCHAQMEEIVLLAPCTNAAPGMARVAGAEKTFRWKIDQHHAVMFAAMLESLAGANEGHHYLETGTPDEITVKASIGEYPENFLIE